MMESNKIVDSAGNGSPEVPSLIRFISCNEVNGFDKMEEIPSGSQPRSLTTKVSFTLPCFITKKQKINSDSTNETKLE